MNMRMRVGDDGFTSQLPEEVLESQTHAIVAGYGPVGRTLVRLLGENSITPTVVELNFKTVRKLGNEGILAIHGDATHREIIKAAGAEKAAVFFLTSSGMRGSDEAIRVARELNPKIRVFARATTLQELPAMRSAGADVVFAAEGEIALTMTEFLLRQLGSTAEQIDRAKDRIRTELFGSEQISEGLVPRPDRDANKPMVTGASKLKSTDENIQDTVVANSNGSRSTVEQESGNGGILPP
jgi:CPA2 family monovalent cation:H+ antiporter-2